MSVDNVVCMVCTIVFVAINAPMCVVAASAAYGRGSAIRRSVLFVCMFGIEALVKRAIQSDLANCDVCSTTCTLCNLEFNV